MAAAVQRRHQRRTPPKPMKINLRHFRFVGGKALTLAKWPTLTDPVYKSQKDYKKLLQAQVSELNDLQHLLYAADSYSLLLIFQAMDAARKARCQLPSPQRGTISFVQHMIMDDFGKKNAGGVTFSEPQGTQFADMDGDGIADLIVGKRFWSHRDNYLDPDSYGPAVLYRYRTVRNPKAPGGAEFVPEVVHNRSGAGSDIFAADINKEGEMDILTATRFGTFVFRGKAGAVKPA